VLRNAILVANAVLIPVDAFRTRLASIVGSYSGSWPFARAQNRISTFSRSQQSDVRTNSAKGARAQLVLNLAGLPIRVLGERDCAP